MRARLRRLSGLASRLTDRRRRPALAAPAHVPTPPPSPAPVAPAAPAIETEPKPLAPPDTPEEAPQPQPEHQEPRLRDPGLTDLSVADWRAVVVRAGREAMDDNVPMIASALAYSAFFAIPSVLLVVLGVFTLLADPQTVADLVEKLSSIAPADAANLFGESLVRLTDQPSTSVLLTLFGLAIAVWATTSAMTTCMTALNLAYERRDRRSFLRKRLTALVMAACVGAAGLLSGGLLVLGPHLEHWLGQALGAETAVAWAWWLGQWPVLVGGLLAAFSVVMYLGPDVDHPRWRFITPGSVAAALVWILVSAAFALYTSSFASYEKTWGSLAAVIITLTWLWLGGVALLFGGELNAETERSRELRQGQPAAVDLQVPHTGERA
jgi:membrane protein